MSLCSLSRNPNHCHKCIFVGQYIYFLKKSDFEGLKQIEESYLPERVDVPLLFEKLFKDKDYHLLLRVPKTPPVGTLSHWVADGFLDGVKHFLPLADEHAKNHAFCLAVRLANFEILKLFPESMPCPPIYHIFDVDVLEYLLQKNYALDLESLLCFARSRDNVTLCKHIFMDLGVNIPGSIWFAQTDRVAALDPPSFNKPLSLEMLEWFLPLDPPLTPEYFQQLKVCQDPAVLKVIFQYGLDHGQVESELYQKVLSKTSLKKKL